MHCSKTLKDCYFLKIKERDAVYIQVTYRKIFSWFSLRSRVSLNITTRQNQVDKNKNFYISFSIQINILNWDTDL